MKIAIVEDDLILAKTIKEFLKTYEVDIFTSSKNLTDNYDLYLIDINLPDINGLELIELFKHKKVLIISGNITPNNINLAYQKGAIDFIKKPFFKEELLNKIELLFPKILEIKYHNIDLSTTPLTSKEIKFLELFKNKDIASFDEIYEAIQKEGNSLYIFVSRLKKKINIPFKNLREIGYQII